METFMTTIIVVKRTRNFRPMMIVSHFIPPKTAISHRSLGMTQSY